jgi:hypothetical protein
MIAVSTPFDLYLERFLLDQGGLQRRDCLRMEFSLDGKRIFQGSAVNVWACVRQFVHKADWGARPEDDNRDCVGLYEPLDSFPFIFGCDYARAGPLNVGHVGVPRRKTPEAVGKEDLADRMNAIKASRKVEAAKVSPKIVHLNRSTSIDRREAPWWDKNGQRRR